HLLPLRRGNLSEAAPRCERLTARASVARTVVGRNQCAANSVCSLPRLRGRVGEGGGCWLGDQCELAAAPTPNPPLPAARLPASGKNQNARTPAGRGSGGEGNAPSCWCLQRHAG